MNRDLLKFEIFSNGVNLSSSEYVLGTRKILVKKGKFKSNLKFSRTTKQTVCEGGFSLNRLLLNSSDLAEDINSDSLEFFCKENHLKANTKKLNYGTLTSNFNINIPLNNSSNNIDLKGSIGYLNSLNPDIKLTGSIPYWVDKERINFGNLIRGLILIEPNYLI